MPSTKVINGRVQLKYDTEANFTSENIVLLKGEAVFVEKLDGSIGFKTGDGVKTFTELPYVSGSEVGLTEEEVTQLINTHNTSQTAHANMGWITTADTAPGEIEDFGIDADTLGGVAADQYAKKSDLSSYLTTTTAESTYAKKTELNSYLTTTTAESTYAKKTELSNYVSLQDFNDTIGNINDLLDIINGEVIE